jgi:hypothetical protein
MRRPPKDFREQFQRIFHETFFQLRRNMNLFRDACDFDAFMEFTAPLCEDERHLAFAFLCRFLPHLTPIYAEASCIAVMSFLSRALGRIEPDASDKLAARALLEMPVKSEGELIKWLESYYQFPP